LLSLLGVLPRIERTFQQLSDHACQSAISFCELLGSCCFVAIHLAPASKDKSKDKIPVGAFAAVDKRGFCGDGPRQQAAGTRRVANLQIHFCQPQRLVWIGTRSKPEFSCMVGESLGATLRPLRLNEAPPSCRVPGIGFISAVLIEVLNFSGNLGHARSANVWSGPNHRFVPSGKRN
jgi:hypothetical protein